MAVLVGMSGHVAGKNFEMDRDEISIGRSSDNTIELDDPAVSGRHCLIVRDGNNYVLRDLGSTNGTRLNSRDVKESILKPKDLIQIGSAELMFDSEDAGDFQTSTFAETQVEIEPGPATAPESFESISPFGARAKDGGKGMWYFLIALVGFLALAAVVVYFISLLTTD